MALANRANRAPPTDDLAPVIEEKAEDMGTGMDGAKGLVRQPTVKALKPVEKKEEPTHITHIRKVSELYRPQAPASDVAKVPRSAEAQIGKSYKLYREPREIHTSEHKGIGELARDLDYIKGGDLPHGSQTPGKVLPAIKSSRPSHVSADHSQLPLPIYSKPKHSSRSSVASQAILAQKLIDNANIRNMERGIIQPSARRLSPTPSDYKRPQSLQK